MLNTPSEEEEQKEFTSLKNKRYSIRFTESQFEKLSKRASESDMNLAEYIRFFLFARRLSDIPIEKKRIDVKKIKKNLPNTPQGQVLMELKSIFQKGLELIEVSDEMKNEVLENRKKPPLQPIKKPSPPRHLNPPKSHVERVKEINYELHKKKEEILNG